MKDVIQTSSSRQRTIIFIHCSVNVLKDAIQTSSTASKNDYHSRASNIIIERRLSNSSACQGHLSFMSFKAVERHHSDSSANPRTSIFIHWVLKRLKGVIQESSAHQGPPSLFTGLLFEGVIQKSATRRRI